MESLKVFSLEGCSKLEKFPYVGENMDSLMELHLDLTGITELSSSIHLLAGLRLLSMNGCKNLESIPISLSGLKALKKLDLSGCSKLKNLPENLEEVVTLEELDISGTSIRNPPTSIFALMNLKALSFDGCKGMAVILTHQVVPSLSALLCLEVLDLHACNLGEGAVPEDIGCLSSLKSLNLSRNYFVTLPKSLNQLSRLEILVLEDCRMLQTLPEVPSKLQTVNLNGCICLTQIPDPIKQCSLDGSWFECLNCWELYKHNGHDSLGLDMLKRYLKSLSHLRPGFGIAVPGTEIPRWFRHQSMGPSISVQVPMKLDGDDSGLIGFTVCVAFSAHDENFSLFCHLKANGCERYPLPMYICCNSIQVLSDHLWLFYLSFSYLRELNDWKHEFFSDIELCFYSYGRGVKVKNCGISLVYFPFSVEDQVPYAFPAGLRVLVIDDDPTSLLILEKMLRACLYEVTKCNRSETALSLLRENKNGYDIVICDIHMPDMDVFKFREHIQLEMDLPVIMMSADDRLNVVMTGVAHGVCEYLVKPIRMKELKNIWQHVVKKRINKWMDLGLSGSVKEGDRLQKQSEDADYSSLANGGSWKNLKRRKEEDGEAKRRDHTSTLKKRRVRWSVELHGQFVAAVNQLGVDKAAPKKILELMNVPWLTREHVASHLQKYLSSRRR